MANENTVQVQETGKITLTTFRPKRIGGADPSVTKLLLGYLVGRGTDTVESKSPDGSQIYTGLKGMFEANITDANGNVIEKYASGKAFISSPFGDKFLDALEDVVNPDTGEVTRPGAESVMFAYKVFVQRASNPNGYEWVLEPLTDLKAENDPLSEMRALLPGVPGAPQIEDKSGKAAK